MGEWNAEVYMTDAAPRGTGINSPDTGVYNVTCIESERVVGANPAVVLRLRLEDGENSGMILPHRIFDSNPDESEAWKRDGGTRDMKAALISLGHDPAQVAKLVPAGATKRVPLTNKYFDGRTGYIYVEAPNPAMGHDFPRILMITEKIADEIKSGARVVAPKHQKPKRGRAVGVAAGLGGTTPALGGAGLTLGSPPENGAGNALGTPPGQQDAAAALSALLG